MYDRFRRRISYLRVSVTDACNLRCNYCVPSCRVTWLDRSAILSFEEIEALARGALNLGIDKLRLTGGEPLVRRGIVKLVAMLGRIQGIKDFAMTTNGVLLADFAADLRLAGLGRLNISLDTLDPDRFREISRGGDLSRVLAGIDAAILAGFQRIKLNCVVESSREETDAQQVAAFGRERGLDVRFIRNMDLREGRFLPVYGGEGGHCNRCNRLRVTSDGRVFPCLFDPRSFSIRKYGIDGALRRAVADKPARGWRSDVSFYAIGG